MKRLTFFITLMVLGLTMSAQSTSSGASLDNANLEWRDWDDCKSPVRPVYFTIREYENGYKALRPIKRYALKEGDLIHIGVNQHKGKCGNVTIKINGRTRTTKAFNIFTRDNVNSLYRTSTRVKAGRIVRFETPFCKCPLEIDLGTIMNR